MKNINYNVEFSHETKTHVFFKIIYNGKKEVVSFDKQLTDKQIIEAYFNS